MKYPRIYHMLVCHGHSPARAGEIILDASRHDAWSIRWIRRTRHMVPRKEWKHRKTQFDRVFTLH